MATVVEGNPDVPFSIGVGKGATSFLGLLYFTLDTNFIILSFTEGDIKYHF